MEKDKNILSGKPTKEGEAGSPSDVKNRGTPNASRDARLKAALRDNLKRRKAQQRGRSEEPPQSDQE